MKITETVERECCQQQDLKNYRLEPNSDEIANIISFSSKRKEKNDKQEKEIRKKSINRLLSYTKTLKSLK